MTGGDKQFLLNPLGPRHSEVTAGNLVKVDLQGRCSTARRTG